MLVKDLMTTQTKIALPTDTIQKVASIMKDLDCGFLPVSSSDGKNVVGVITDRDIAVRSCAEGCDPKITVVDQMKSDSVHYCFSDESIEKAVQRMEENRVYRLLVLDKEENVLCGVISLGDITRHDDYKLAAEAAREISLSAA